MKCISEFKDASYGNRPFCEACGMDIGFNPLKVSHKGHVKFYCCEDCLELG